MSEPSLGAWADGTAVRQLLGVIAGAEIERATRPHVVLHRDADQSIIGCSGPYASAFDAFAVAAEIADELGDDEQSYLIVPMIGRGPQFDDPS